MQPKKDNFTVNAKWVTVHSQMSPFHFPKLTLQSLRNDFPSLRVLVQVLEAVLLPVSKQTKEKMMLNDVAT